MIIAIFEGQAKPFMHGGKNSVEFFQAETLGD